MRFNKLTQTWSIINKVSSLNEAIYSNTTIVILSLIEWLQQYDVEWSFLKTFLNKCNVVWGLRRTREFPYDLSSSDGFTSPAKAHTNALVKC